MSYLVFPQIRSIFFLFFFVVVVPFLTDLILLFSIPSFKKIFVNFYFWLCWVFVVARGLSLVVVSGGDSLVVVCWPHCGGLSCCRTRALGCTGFSSCGT